MTFTIFKKTWHFFGIFLLIISTISIGLMLYFNNIKSQLSSATYETLAEITQQQKFNFYSEITADVNSIENFAVSMQYLPDNKEEVASLLTQLLENTNFDYLAVLNTDGIGVGDKGNVMDLSDREYFQEAMSGNTVIGNPIQSQKEDDMMIPIAAPIKIDGSSRGVLVGAYSADKLEELILPSYGGKGFAYVSDSQGNLIVKPNNENAILIRKYNESNLFNGFQKATFLKFDDYDQIYNNVQDNSSGLSIFEIDGNVRFMHYSPLGVKDWHIFVVVPEAVIAAAAVDITQKTAALALVSVLLFSVFLIYIIYLLRKYEKVQKAHTRELEHIAYVDELTGGPTFAKFKLEAQRFIDDNPDKRLLMVRFDIDQFKLINQTLGLKAGDKVLINMAKALEINTPGEYQRYARLHDDEYLVLHEYEYPEQLIEIRDNFQKIFRELMGNEFTYEVKIVSGHYYMEFENCTDASEAIEKAGIAHRKAKQTGNEIIVYDANFVKQALKDKDIENRMKAALANCEFKVYLQPKYRLQDETIGGAEALVRWQTADQDIMYPGSFIPIFENNGFIIKLDMYIFEQVCIIIRRWMDKGIPPVTVSVNFSRYHLNNTSFVTTLSNLADQYHVPRKLLEVEITETAIFDNEEVMMQTLTRLHQAGFKLSMDDFGTGYSSLGLLKNLPVDIIKLDRSFFMSADTEELTKVVVSCIVEMTKQLGIQTVAEGVERKEHIVLLASLGCDMVQGYYYARPMPANQLFEKNKSN